MKSNITTKNFIQKAMNVHGTKYDYAQVVYHKMSEKVTIICQKHGNFLQQAGNHLMGTGCPKCSIRPKQSTEEFIQKAKQQHGEKYDYSKTMYEDRKIKITYKCPKHGLINQLPYTHLKSGCAKCAGKGLSNDEIIQLMNESNNFRYTYDPLSFTQMDADVKATCKKHGDFFINISYHIHKKIGCKICYNTYKRSKNLILSKEEWVRRSKLIHGETYDYTISNYISAHDKIMITCYKHGDFLQSAAAHVRGSGCPKCSMSNRSSIESSWLDYMNVPNNPNNRNVYIKLDDKGYYFDGIVDNTVYEFYGNYWHGNPKTHNPNEINKHNKTTFRELYEATLKKERIILQHGFKIISIWESEWKTILKQNRDQI